MWNKKKPEYREEEYKVTIKDTITVSFEDGSKETYNTINNKNLAIEIFNNYQGFNILQYINTDSYNSDYRTVAYFKNGFKSYTCTLKEITLKRKIKI